MRFSQLDRTPILAWKIAKTRSHCNYFILLSAKFGQMVIQNGSINRGKNVWTANWHSPHCLSLLLAVQVSNCKTEHKVKMVSCCTWASSSEIWFVLLAFVPKVCWFLLWIVAEISAICKREVSFCVTWCRACQTQEPLWHEKWAMHISPWLAWLWVTSHLLLTFSSSPFLCKYHTSIGMKHFPFPSPNLSKGKTWMTSAHSPIDVRCILWNVLLMMWILCTGNLSSISSASAKKHLSNTKTRNLQVEPCGVDCCWQKVWN